MFQLPKSLPDDLPPLLPVEIAVANQLIAKPRFLSSVIGGSSSGWSERIRLMTTVVREKNYIFNIVCEISKF